MQQSTAEPVKHREIGFRDPHPDPHQARSALLLLSDVDGIVHASLPHRGKNLIHISYDLRKISLCLIETLLLELGFHLDNSLLAKLKRALYHYTEENEMQTWLINDDLNHSTREIFLRCYRCKTHGCRDQRPAHWRNYL